MEAEATEAGGMGAEAMEVSGMEVGGMEVSGMGATGGEAHGWGSASALDRSGGRTGGHTGAGTGDLMPMATPIRTRPSLLCHPPSSLCNPQHRPLPSPRHQCIGITATKHGGTTPTCSNVQGDGEPWPPRRHREPRLAHPSIAPL
jgi:hypothetical protein